MAMLEAIMPTEFKIKNCYRLFAAHFLYYPENVETNITYMRLKDMCLQRLECRSQ